MAFYTLCPGCLSGDHTQHVEHWGKRPEGVIDADICLCSGDCSERAATVAQTLRHMFLGLYSDTQVAGRVDPETTEWDKPRFYPAPPPPVVEPIDLPVAVALSVLEALPERVRRRRAELGLSYRQAAEAAGLDYNTFWRIEHGANMSLRAAIALLRWLAQPIP